MDAPRREADGHTGQVWSSGALQKNGRVPVLEAVSALRGEGVAQEPPGQPHEGADVSHYDAGGD